MDPIVNYSPVLMGKLTFLTQSIQQETIIIAFKGQPNGIFLSADYGILDP